MVEDVKKNRFLFLKELWEITNGDSRKSIATNFIGQKLNFDNNVSKDIAIYLQQENLIKISNKEVNGFLISITHFGVKEVETALSNPEKSAEPPISIISIGTMTNSQFQHGSPGATQTMSVSESNFEEFKNVIQELKNSIDQLELEIQQKADLQAELATIQTQLSSSKPKQSVLSECIKSVRTILEGATGSVAAAFLIKIIGLG